MTEKNIFNKGLRDLAPEIWSLAREAELGELRHVYHASKRDTSIMIFGMLCLFLAGFWIREKF